MLSLQLNGYIRGDHQDGQGSDFFYDNKTGLPVYRRALVGWSFNTLNPF
jgi:hypothetical protein